jgi:glycosyltransferase involved in cell wall biosynthesis
MTKHGKDLQEAKCKMQYTTAVIICAYTEQRWDQLVTAVRSVEHQETPVDEVIVVIDHNPELLQRAKKGLPRAQVVASTGPRGLSGARNTGIRWSTGDIVFFLDDDASADPKWIGYLLACYENPHVLGVGGAALPLWEASAPQWWPEEFLWVVGCSYRGQPRQKATVRNMMGCNMSLRRTVLAAVGGFDVELGRTADAPLGCEETELCIRAQKIFEQGIFLFEPKSVVNHHVPETRVAWKYFISRCSAEGVSKAWVTERVGKAAALSQERQYAFRVLPRGITQGIKDAFSGDLYGLVRAGAILAGGSVTALSFTGARLRWWTSTRRTTGAEVTTSV